MFHTALQCIICFHMTDGEIKTNGIFIGCDPVQDDIVHTFSKFIARIVGFHAECANQQPAQIFQFTRSLQVIKHPVNAIQVFTDVFEKKDHAIRAQIRCGTRKGFDGFQITPREYALAIAIPVCRIKNDRVINPFAG